MVMKMRNFSLLAWCKRGFCICQETGFGGLVVSMLASDIRGSNPAEAVGFLSGEKSSAFLPSEGK
jgi:hypothetical protein